MSQLLPNTEKLKFKIVLSGTFWDKRPAFSIWLNDTLHSSGSIDSGEHQSIEFLADLLEDSEHQLKIRLENKTDEDTIVVNNVIVKDMLLNIESIEIDDIDIVQLKWDKSKFIPDDTDRREVLLNCVNLGWNGTYTISFTSPFYIWLLENI